MNILSTPKLKTTLSAAMFAAATVFSTAVASNKLEKTPKQDTYEANSEITPQGTTSDSILAFAPSPMVKIKDETKIATIVIDLSQNVLYHYDSDGQAKNAYLVASGMKESPTDKGIRVVSHVETYPYTTAYGTKRKRNPKAYGPNAIIPLKIDPKTGATSQTGELIHGNNDASSIGFYKSLGCIRMDNEVIKQLAKTIKSGDIIVIQ